MTPGFTRATVYQALSGDTSTRPNRMVSLVLVLLILLNVLAVVLGSVESLEAQYGTLFDYFESFSVAVFLAEYLLRVWSCTAVLHYRSPTMGRLRFMLTPLAIIDLLSILPTLLVWTGIDLRFLRMLRLVRMLRLAKLGRYSEALQLMGHVLKQKRESLLLSLAVMLLVLVVSSSLIFMTEHDQQPEAFSSIPASMWWGIMTLTTVGYGDIYPITPVGKLLGAFISICGIAMFALPTAILGSAFFEFTELRKLPTAPRVCPHCGKPVDDDTTEQER
jgi:voltage-gated potassium channel